MNQTEIDRRIEAQVDRLVAGLRLNSSEREAISREWRDHLQESCAELIEQGLPAPMAIDRSIARFGHATDLDQAIAPLGWRRDLRWAVLQAPLWLWCWIALEVLALPLWSALLWPSPGLATWLYSLLGVATLLIALMAAQRLGLARMRRSDRWPRLLLSGAATLAASWVVLLGLPALLPWVAEQSDGLGSATVLRALLVAALLTLLPLTMARRQSSLRPRRLA